MNNMPRLVHMSTKIPKDVVEERLRWVKPIVDKHIKLVDVMKVFPNSQRTLERWITNYRKYGGSGLKPKSTRPKTNPNETPIRIKERIIELRKLKNNKCSIKLKIDLKKKG
jgi:transposase